MLLALLWLQAGLRRRRLPSPLLPLALLGRCWPPPAAAGFAFSFFPR